MDRNFYPSLNIAQFNRKQILFNETFTFDLGLQHGGVVNAQHIDVLGLARRNAVLVHAHHHILASINARL